MARGDKETRETRGGKQEDREGRPFWLLREPPHAQFLTGVQLSKKCIRQSLTGSSHSLDGVRFAASSSGVTCKAESELAIRSASEAGPETRVSSWKPSENTLPATETRSKVLDSQQFHAGVH